MCAFSLTYPFFAHVKCVFTDADVWTQKQDSDKSQAYKGHSQKDSRVQILDS